MKNEPKLWRKLLSESPEGSVLMGGAVIDFLLLKEAKDYDIFHTYKIGMPEIPANWIPTEADFNDPDWVKEHQELYLQGDGGNGIGSVYEYLVDGEHKVQLIGVHYKNPVEHMKNFDHSLTLGRYSKNGIFIHDKVMKSLEENTIEYINKNKSMEARAKSFVRAHNKGLKYGGQWNYKGFYD